MKVREFISSKKIAAGRISGFGYLLKTQRMLELAPVRICLAAAVLLGILGFAPRPMLGQGQPPVSGQLVTPSAQPKKLVFDPDKPDAVLATVDGTVITNRKFQEILVTLPEKARDNLRANPLEVLRMYGWMQRLSREAEKRGIDKQSPYAQQLEMNRLNVLSQAMMQTFEFENLVQENEISEFYAKNQDRYTTANVKLIYLPYSSATEEAQAKKRGDELFAKLKAGAKFVDLVKEFSKDETSKAKDGDYGPIRRSDQIPDSVKSTIFALKPGEFSGPVKLANGWYLFLMKEVKVDPFAAVRDQIFTEIKQERSRVWAQEMRNKVAIQVSEDSVPAQPPIKMLPAPAKP